MVSHDRYFMDRMVEHLFVFEGEGIIRDFPGNYGLYQQWLKTKESAPASTENPVQKTVAKEPVSKKEKPKLSYKDKREFEILEKEIDELNREKENITDKLREPSLAYEEIEKLSQRFTFISENLQTKEFRWLELSEIQD